MPKGGKDIRRRIRSVSSTQQITKAMKMVAASKLKRSQSRTEASRPYSDTVCEVLSRISALGAELEHPYLRHIAPEIGNVLAVLFTGDKGLCGAFNSHLIRRTEHFIAEQRQMGRDVTLILAGKKGNAYFKRRAAQIAGFHLGFTNKTTYADLRPLTEQLTSAYLAKQVSEVYLIYGRFVNVMKSAPTVLRLLPIEALEAEAGKPGARRVEYDLEPSPEELLRTLLPRYFQTILFQAAIENFTSENGARMVAMDNATTAAGEMIDALTLQYNKARQAAITFELLDIVGGAEALKG
jgi:F-type H+-transporting ATPase subunit gamma